MARKITKSIRFQILNRDGNKCVVCGRGPADGVKLHVDHIFPVAEGGTDNLDNLQTLCDDCNLGKSNFIIKPQVSTKIGFEVPEEYVLDQTIQALSYYRNSTRKNDLTLGQLVATVNHAGTTDRINPLFRPLPEQLILTACLTLAEENQISMEGLRISILDIDNA